MDLSSSSDLQCWLDQYRVSDCGECESYLPLVSGTKRKHSTNATKLSVASQTLALDASFEARDLQKVIRSPDSRPLT